MSIMYALALVMQVQSTTQIEVRSLENHSVSTRSTDIVSEHVGTRGIDGFDESGTYAFVLAPTIEKSGGIFIPENLKAAAEEIERMLPLDFKLALRISVIHDQTGRPWIECTSTNDTTDSLLILWMSVHWKLEEPDSPLVRFFKKSIGDHATPSSIASDALVLACRNFLVD